MKICLFISFFLITLSTLSRDKSEIICKASIAIDSNSKCSILDYNRLPSHSISSKELINLGYNNNYAVWCTFKIKNNSNKRKTTWVCFNNNRIDSLELWMNNNYQLIGDRTENNSPFIMVPAFKIELEPHQTVDFVVRLKKGISFFDFSYSIQDESQLEKDSRLSIFLISFFSGLTFLFWILTVILFLITKQRLYLYYISYSILTMTYVIIATGFAKFILSPQVTYFSEGLIYTGSIWFISLSLFIAKYLELKTHQNKKYKLILFLVGCNIAIIIITILQLTFHDYTYLKLLSTLGYINFLLTIVVLIISSVSHLKINKLLAIYALISFLPHFIWALSIILQAFNIPIFDVHANWLVIIAFFDVLFFGLLLIKQYFETYKKNDVLKQSIIENQIQTIQSIEEAQIRERKQIANIIHDHFGSKLTHILHLLELDNHHLAEKNIRELTKEMRDVSHQILPKSLENGAFLSAMQNQVNQFNEGLTNSKIELHSFDFPDKQDETLAVTLFLISLEIISNSLKHGDANEITIELYGYPDMLVLQLSDNGKGYNTVTQAKGFGITTIETRITNLGGTVEISSVPNEGTYVQISIQK